MNTAIIHSYSTLPYNGCIHRLSKKYRYKQGFSDRSVLFESAGSEKQKTELVGSDELKPIVSEPMSVVLDHPALCPASTGPICHYAHLLLKGPKTVRRMALGHSISDIIGCGYFLETDFP